MTQPCFEDMVERVGLKDGDIRARVREQIVANHTGNHHRNHNVKYVKQSDGRVRG